MHRSVVTIVALSVMAVQTPAGSPGGDGFQFLSPLPGSRLVMPASNIIIRHGELIDPESIRAGNLLVVTGSSTGVHSGNVTLSDDGMTLVFVPAHPFGGGELVDVQLRSGLRSLSGKSIAPLRFTFTTRPDRQNAALTLQKKYSPDDDFAGAAPPSQPRLGKSATVGSDPLPADFPAITTVAFKSAPPGFLFLSNFTFDLGIPNTPYLMILTYDGSPLFYRQMLARCLDFKIQPNGLMTYYDGSLGYFLEMDKNYSLVDSFQCGNGYTTDDHELRLLPDGHALLMSYDNQVVEMDTVVKGGSLSAIVVGLVIQELDRAKNVVFQWRSWDHFQITDAVGLDLTSGYLDYVHGNALEVDADGNLILSSRHMDEITKINRQTGDIIWRWGGKHNQFTLVNDTLWFSHQHAVRRIANGHITLFDNGNFHSPPFSRAVEYALDESTKTATLTWEYRHNPDVFGGAMGYVQRLSDGSTLIGWGATNPSVTLVSSAGDPMMELSLPNGVYSYRAYTFAEALLSVPSIASGVAAGFVLEQNYPNPFNPSTTIRYSLPQRSNVTLTVFNTLGQEVARLVNGEQEGGSHEIRFDASGLASGAYFYRIQAGSFVESKKLLLLR